MNKTTRRTWTTIVIALVLLIIGVIFRKQASVAAKYWPTENWRTSAPEKQDMDPTLLDRLVAYIEEHDTAIDSVIVTRHGYIVLEEYRNGYTKETRHHIQSVTKSFSSTLIGIALQNNLIESVDQRVVDFFPDREIEKLDARKERLTLKHLLTMSDGMDWHEVEYPYTDQRNSLGRMWLQGDVIQYVLDQPMVQEPGESWSYNSGTSILLGSIVEQATGQDLLSFAQQALFDPLGITDVVWSKADPNHYHSDGGLYLTPRDMARLGYLMLNNGTWDGQEIVSADWVAEASSSHYLTTSGLGYGYQWWVWPEMGVFGAQGHYGQKIYVVPKDDLVVVFTGNIADEDPHPEDGLLFSFIIPSVEGNPQHNRYDQFGFAFDYPAGMSPRQVPMPGGAASSVAMGAVQFQSELSPVEIISIFWDTSTPDETASEFLDQSVSLVAQSGAEITGRGPVDTMTSSDRPVVYTPVEFSLQGLDFSSVLGALECDSSRIFALVYVTESYVEAAEVMAGFEQSLDAFSCSGSDT